jgi:cyanate permease
MWWYKLKKFFNRGSLKSFITDALGTTLLISAIYLFIIPLIASIDRSERKMLFLISALSFLVNIPILLYFDTFNISILLKMLFTMLSGYFIFLPFIFIGLLYNDVNQIELNRDEKRDAILGKILNRF